MQNVGFERVVIGIAKEPAGLGLIESKLFSSQFGQFAAGSQGCRRQVWCPPARQNQVQPRGRPGDEALDHCPNRRHRLYHMEVVQNERRLHLTKAIHLGEQRSQDRLFTSRFDRRFGQQGRRSLQQPRVHRLACRDDVPKEDEAVGVVLVQPVPEGSNPRPTEEVGDQSGLAEASLGDHVDDPAIGSILQPVEQAVAPKRIVGQQGTLHLAGAQREARPDMVGILGKPVADLGLYGHPQLLHPQPTPDRRCVG